MSRSPTRLPLYCKITFENIWLGSCISNHFISKTERKDVVKMLAGYYLIVNLLVTMAINFGYTPARPIESLTLARRGTMVGFAPINEHLAGSLIM